MNTTYTSCMLVYKERNIYKVGNEARFSLSNI